MDRRRFNTALLASGAVALLPQGVRAQGGPPADWPKQTVRVIVPFPAGGTSDALPRLIADVLTQVWKQPVVIENRPGAGGNVGAEVVAFAAPAISACAVAAISPSARRPCWRRR